MILFISFISLQKWHTSLPQAVFTLLVPSFLKKYKLMALGSYLWQQQIDVWFAICLEYLLYHHFLSLYSLQNTCQTCYPDYPVSALRPQTRGTTTCASKVHVLFEKHHIKADWFSSGKCQTSAHNVQLHFSETAKFRKSQRPERSLTHRYRCDRSTTLLPEMSSNRMRQSMKNNKSIPDRRSIFCTCIRKKTTWSLENPVLNKLLC